jgi:hypothetical protein
VARTLAWLWKIRKLECEKWSALTFRATQWIGKQERIKDWWLVIGTQPGAWRTRGDCAQWRKKWGCQWAQNTVWFRRLTERLRYFWVDTDQTPIGRDFDIWLIDFDNRSVRESKGQSDRGSEILPAGIPSAATLRLN